MNVVLLSQQQISDDGSAYLNARQRKHVVEVLKLVPGDTLRIGQLNGNMGLAKVEMLSSDAVVLKTCLDQPPPQESPVKLVLAVPRPKALRRVIEHSVGLGVKEIHLIHSWKVEKSFWQSPLLNQGALDEMALLGLEQAGDTVLPLIQQHKRFKPFVEDRLPDISAGTQKVLADPRGASVLSECEHSKSTLVIGPDSGFTPYETEQFISQGFAPYHMGPRTLKVETAVTAGISLLSII